MPSSVDLGKRLQATVDKLVAKGRYNSRSEVLREGVRLVEEREKRLADLDAKLDEGLTDIAAGRTYPADEVFADLRRRFSGKPMRAAKKSMRG
jgi:antitoxin ParD1/3/4